MRRLQRRFLLACVIVPPRTDTVRVAVVAQLFKRYGLSSGPHPLGQRVSTVRRERDRGRDCLALSGRLDQGRRSRWSASSRASPRQNGRSRRAHASDQVKAETAKPPAASAGQQQVRLRDRFRQSTLQRRTVLTRGAWPAAACGVLPALAAALRPERAWTSPGTMPGTPCAGCAPTASIKSPAATWSSSARR